jgi:hypothetical protein
MNIFKMIASKITLMVLYMAEGAIESYIEQCEQNFGYSRKLWNNYRLNREELCEARNILRQLQKVVKDQY